MLHLLYYHIIGSIFNERLTVLSFFPVEFRDYCALVFPRLDHLNTCSLAGSVDWVLNFLPFFNFSTNRALAPDEISSQVYHETAHIFCADSSSKSVVSFD